MTTYSRPGRPQVHGTVDPDRQPAARSHVDRGQFDEFNAGVRRARAGVVPPTYPPAGKACHWCRLAKSGRCKRHTEDA